MLRKFVKPANNEDGMMIILSVLFIVVILSVAGIYASRTASTESEIVRNDQIHTRDFYMSEAGVTSAFENPSTWLTTAMLLNPDTKGIIYDVAINDTGGNNLSSVTIAARSVVSPQMILPESGWDTTGTSATDIATMVGIANDVPVKYHFKTVIGSGDSISSLVQRNYSVTVFSEDGTGLVQVGGYKAFPNSGS